MNRDLKMALIIGGVIVLALMLMSIVIGYSGGWQWSRHFMMGPGMMRGGFMSVMVIVWIVIVALIIWAVVAAIQSPRESGTSKPAEKENSALEILDQRYARGEIDRDEYIAVKKDLEL